jgi:hypothetical protein
MKFLITLPVTGLYKKNRKENIDCNLKTSECHHVFRVKLILNMKYPALR